MDTRKSGGGRFGTNRQRVLAAATALVGFGAASASASTISLLQSGDAGGGMTLNSSNVLLAASALDSNSHSGEIQGVTFTPMSLVAASTSATITQSGLTATLVNDNASGGSNSGINVTTPTGGSSFSFTTNTTGSTALYPSPYPTDDSSNNLVTLLSSAANFAKGGSDANHLVLTVSGLTPGQPYDVDLLFSALASSRSEYVLFNGGDQTSTANLIQYGSFAPEVFNGYDANDTLDADINGDITVEMVCTTTSSPPVFSGIVISSVPEPASLGLLALSGLGLLMRRRRPADGAGRHGEGMPNG